MRTSNVSFQKTELVMRNLRRICQRAFRQAMNGSVLCNYRSMQTRTALKRLTTGLGLFVMLSATFAGTDTAPLTSTSNSPTVVMIQLGEKWYIPQDLAEIVRTDAKRQK